MCTPLWRVSCNLARIEQGRTQESHIGGDRLESESVGGCLSAIYGWLRLLYCHAKVEQSFVYRTAITDERLQLLNVAQIDLLLKDYDFIEGHHRNAGGEQSV